MKTLILCLLLAVIVQPSGYLVPRCEWRPLPARAVNASLTVDGIVTCQWVPGPKAAPYPVFNFREAIG